MSSVGWSFRKSPIMDEFDKDEIDRFFHRKQKAVLPHIDTLYYSVSVFGDDPNCLDRYMNRMLEELADAKAAKLAAMQEDIQFCGLSVMPTGFSIYEYRLSMNETFDIFISKYLPNAMTPRIVVQLRSRSLVLDGVTNAILDSFRHVKLILSCYGLSVGCVRENRIDYAYHTNCIQNPYRFFADEKLLGHLRSKMRVGKKVFEIHDDIQLTYFALGNQKSNNVFFRCYDKTREVVEENYKPFFIERWLAYGLISEYDAYVLRRAFTFKSYRTGLLIGKIDWYEEYGRDYERKEILRKVRETAFIRNDNIEYLEKEVNKLLPPTTLIMNVEFQTKRKFYVSLGEWLDSIYYEYQHEPDLTPLMKLLSVRTDILNYLTSETVRFVVDRKEPTSDFCDWWRRINGCRMEFSEKSDLEIWREKDRKVDLDRSKRRLQSAIAQCHILRSKSLDASTFHADVSDALCCLNDNDFYGSFVNKDGEIMELTSKGYEEIQRRKARQYKGIVKPDAPVLNIPGLISEFNNEISKKISKNFCFLQVQQALFKNICYDIYSGIHKQKK